MLPVIGFLLCLILGQIFPSSPYIVTENSEKVEATTAFTNIPVPLPHSSQSSINITKTVQSESPKNAVKVIPNNQRPSSINNKGYFPNIAANFDDKHLILIEFFNKLSPYGWLQPFQEKIQKVSEFLTHPNHPGLNLGGFHNFNAENWLERLHEKGHQLLTGPKVSIYGTRPITNFDFPFAYRNNKIN